MSTLSMPEAQAILRARGITPADYEGHRRYAAAGVLMEHGASRSARGGRHGENAYELCMRYQCEIEGNKLCRILWPAISAKYGFQA